MASVTVRSNNIDNIVLGSLNAKWSARGDRILRYYVDVRHAKLNVHKEVSAPEIFILQSKLDALMASWDEKSIVEYEEGRKLTHAKVTKKFTGDLEGESVLEYLMIYPPTPPVPYVGIERFVGSFLGKKGSFALTITGIYDGTAKEKAGE